MTIYAPWARHYDAIHAFKDYETESARLLSLIRTLHPEARSLLDIACGTGRHLQLLAAEMQVEGLDCNPELLAVARERMPATPLHCARMEDFTLPRRFDAISCMFSSIGFVGTPEQLNMTVANMSRHLEPGGLLVIEPWFTRESFWTGTIVSRFLDEPELKIAWMYTTGLEDGLSILDNHFQIGTRQGIENFREVHRLGLFSPEDFSVAFEQAGLARIPVQDPAWKRGLHVARRLQSP
jgi:SAM-dependent methyltransferase